MLVIRLRRTGKKNKPTYRIVVAEHSFPLNGKFTADLGFYNPHTKQTGLNVAETTVWLGKGARPSNTVAKILTQEKIKHPLVVVVKKNKSPKKTAEPTKAPAESATPEEVTAKVTEAPTEVTETPATSPETAEAVAEEAPETPTEEEAPASEESQA